MPPQNVIHILTGQVTCMLMKPFKVCGEVDHSGEIFGTKQLVQRLFETG